MPLVVHDTIIIGAGIAGCCIGHSLSQKGQDVLIIDRSSSPANGGSGAAGAFISPKIGKGSVLQELTNEAYLFAIDFYRKNFSDYFYQTGVIRMPKDREDALKFVEYEASNYPGYKWLYKDKLSSIGIKNTNDSFLFEDAGVCDAPAMCRAICDGIPFRQFNVEILEHDGNRWCVASDNETLWARNLVLATGYENALLDMRYMGVKGTWGSRGDYSTKLGLNVSVHKKISISANIDGIVKMGATHVKSNNPCMVCDGRPLAGIEEQASDMVYSDDFVLKEIFCGMRAGSKDYFPLVGRVIDTLYMFENYPAILKGAKPQLEHIESLFVLNGLGGRGFVFAPMMGEMLARHILFDEDMDDRVNPDRLFLRWARRLKN